jgi:hypothetical protein
MSAGTLVIGTEGEDLRADVLGADAIVLNATSGESPKPVPLATGPLADFRDHVGVSLLASPHAFRSAVSATRWMTSDPLWLRCLPPG